MGCGSSQAVSVVNTESTTKSSTSQQHQKTELKLQDKKPPSKLEPLPSIHMTRYDSGISSKVDSNSTHSDNLSERRNSISSNSDSFCLEGEYKNVITEKSNKDVVEKVEKEFVERNELNLAVNGKGCPPLLSDKEKEKELLTRNGLVLKPILQKPNSAHFEIKAIDSTNKEVRAPPPRLARERTKIMTAEEIEEKLERANQRKQGQLEQIRLKSSISISKAGESLNDSEGRQQSATMSLRPQSAVSRQLSANYRPKSSTYRQLSANNEEVIERQKKLREIRDKLKAKDSQKNSNNNDPTLTPRTKEIVDEYDVFRPKTPAAFKPEF